MMPSQQLIAKAAADAKEADLGRRAQDLALAMGTATAGLGTDDATTVISFALATELHPRVQHLDPRRRKAVLGYVADRTAQAVDALDQAPATPAVGG